MKKCSKCNQTYLDDDLNFCLTDGGRLDFMTDPEETVIRVSPFLQQPSPTVRQGVSPVFAYLAVGLLALIVGGGIIMWFKSDTTVSVKSDSLSNSSFPSPSTRTLNDSDLLQGVWQAQYGNIDGKDVSEKVSKFLQFTFKGDRLNIKGNFDDDRAEETNYKIDSTKSPKQLDILQKPPILAIYELNNDELKVCIKKSPPPSERPNSCISGENMSIVVFKKQKL